MKTKLKIVKIGGNIIDDEALLKTFLSDFAQLEGPKILVHGGGKIATKMNSKMGIETKMVSGRRITSSENLETVTMVYAGLVNKNIVSKLQGFNCNSLGLSGSDANCILATKRPTSPIDFGWVGDVVSVNSNTIALFLSNNITPVFCAISHDGKGQLLNTNADTVASEIAIAMSDDYTTELIYCFEKKGVLSDVNDDNSVLTQINELEYTKLKAENIIYDGMLPKMENCFYALNNKVNKVLIGDVNTIKHQENLFTTLTLN